MHHNKTQRMSPESCESDGRRGVESGLYLLLLKAAGSLSEVVSQHLDGVVIVRVVLRPDVEGERGNPRVEGSSREVVGVNRYLRATLS